MIKKYFYSGVVALLFTGMVLVQNVQANETTDQTLSKQLQALMAQVEELQKKLATLKTEIRTVIKDGLSEGATHEDIKRIQEILATDPSIYPRGLVTGYYGTLTKEAIKKFQLRHELKSTGELDEETREWFEAYLGEMHDGKIPSGLLKAPGIIKKVELKYKENCDDSNHANGPLCKRRMAANDDNTELEIFVEEHSGKTHVHIEYTDNTTESFFVESPKTDEDGVVTEIIKKTDLTKDAVETVIKYSNGMGGVHHHGE